MSLHSRKFSMNRQTGVPRESTKLGRRFSTHEPSANGMYSWLFSFAFFPWRLSLYDLELLRESSYTTSALRKTGRYMPLLTRNKQPFYTSSQSAYWSTTSFISGTQTNEDTQKRAPRSIRNSAMLTKATSRTRGSTPRAPRQVLSGAQNEPTSTAS